MERTCAKGGKGNGVGREKGIRKREGGGGWSRGEKAGGGGHEEEVG